MAIKIQKLDIPEILLVEAPAFEDERGYFMETFKQSDFAKAGLPENFVQDNFSYSQKNVLRGLHYQLPPFAQGKLVRVVDGVIWDVAVDVRQSSPTFKKWVAYELSDKNRKAFYIPPGFAHGFVVLSETAKVYYKTTAEYNKESERGVVWNDPQLNIGWPVQNPVLSDKDKGYPNIANLEALGD